MLALSLSEVLLFWRFRFRFYHFFVLVFVNENHTGCHATGLASFFFMGMGMIYNTTVQHPAASLHSELMGECDAMNMFR